MKKFIALLIFLIPLISIAQDYREFLKTSFLGRQPSARAEALGKGYSAMDGDLSSIFYNPAGTATLKGLELNSSFASPYYHLEDAKYTFLAAGFNINKYLTVGVSYNHFDTGEELPYIDPFGNLQSAIPTNSFYTLNLSSEPIKNLYVGINSNYLVWKPNDETGTVLYFDFGVIKKFEFGTKEKSQQSVNIGASIVNLNFAEIELVYHGSNGKDNLPVTTRYGVNYELYLDNHWVFDTLHTFQFLVQAEYQLLLNSDYYNGIHSGLEVLFLEMLALRVGYYSENVNDYGRPDELVNEFNEFTYGFGLQVPLNKLTNIPINVYFDYTSLPQPSNFKIKNDLDNFSSYTIRAVWVLRE